ncbi:MAG: hypothetical protein R3C61_15990 [Bacteroidia bacterium]
MTKAIQLLTALMTIFVLSSFTNPYAHEFTGTYGVSESDPSQIQLTINPDNTFYFQDFSVPEKKIVAKGTWSMKGKRIILEQNNANEKFHNVWTILESGQVAKSRKGFTFYRLCKIEE